MFSFFFLQTQKVIFSFKECKLNLSDDLYISFRMPSLSISGTVSGLKAGADMYKKAFKTIECISNFEKSNGT